MRLIIVKFFKFLLNKRILKVMNNIEICKALKALANGHDYDTGEAFDVSDKTKLALYSALDKLDYIGVNELTIAPEKKDKVDKTISITGDDNTLLEALKERRLKLKYDHDIDYTPAIATNATLKEITINKPTSLKQLIEINGVGPAILTKYGDSFLAVVKDHIVKYCPELVGNIVQDEEIVVRPYEEGKCLDCGVDIPQSRLDSGDDILRCVECQTTYEKNS
jgi:hypothetical protein